ncbi:MAG: chromate efflux transporter [Dehalococcoidia bacterium]|nr:chromate efflux transporter [Dehalococcoidia bacterium]
MTFGSVPSQLREVAALFLRLGFFAFGGPAAHIAMMRDEVVSRRKWMTDQEFLDLLGIANLIPGPNSTEMTMHLGLERAGWRGLIAGGTLFIFPAFLIVLVLAVLYDEYGTTPSAEWILYGIKPVVIAIIAQAVWRLGLVAIRPAPWLLAGGAAVMALYLLGVHELVLLFAGGITLALARHVPALYQWFSRRTVALAAPFLAMPVLAYQAAEPLREYSHATLGLTFLKIGALLYGSGYVLVAFLQRDFVDNLGWLTEQQLLDAIAIGQLTPGPVFTTATFVGYITGGLPGAFIATAAIFAPGFLYVAMVNPLLPRLRGNIVASALIDGVNIAAIGLMAGVLAELLRSGVVDIWTGAILALAAVALFRNLNTTWLIVGGALLGIAFNAFDLA